VIGGYTQPGGERKYMGALLVGVYENRKLKFAGRVGTGFSEKLLKALSLELNKIAVKACPFYNLPTPGRGLDPGLTAAGMKRCVWVNPTIVCEAKFTEWTRDDRLRHPVFLGIREDKSPSSVVERRRAKDFSTGNLDTGLDSLGRPAAKYLHESSRLDYRRRRQRNEATKTTQIVRICPASGSRSMVITSGDAALLDHGSCKRYFFPYGAQSLTRLDCPDGTPI
jgi:hypothetical protein